MTPSLTFSGAGLAWPVAAFVLVVGLALIWGYRSALGHPLRWLLAGLKAAGVTLLALCVLEPLWLGQRAKPGANLIAIAADNSQSLRVREPGEQRTRGERMLTLLDPQAAGWQGALAATFDVRRYAFDTRLQSVRDFSGLTFDGRATGLGSSLRALGARFQGRPLAGVLLFTDGNATDLPGGTPPDLTGLPPVYPVVVGSRNSAPDIAVQQVTVGQTSFEDAPVTVQADVATTGYRGRAIVARLTDRTGRVVEEQQGTGRADGDSLAFRFRVKPDQPGVSFYQFSVAAADEPPPAAGTTAPPRTTEATLANNSRVLAVDRGQGPFRVLYVSGRPNWEYKFLNRAVQGDEQVQLVGLIRVAKREPKFDFRGREGETSNPLFRGFGSQAADEVQRYDQPVLVRLNTKDELELRAGFPRTPEELYGYHAVILDDLEAEFFTRDQAVLLQKFVSERGGGLLMLGGMECFHEGRYLRTPIGDMLPVYLDLEEGGANPPGKVHFQLTREGWLQPWARLRDNEGDERARLDAMPAFEVLNRVRALKPGASVIASVRDEKGGEHPALAVQRFGRGRTGALMVGDFWRWGMRDPAAREDLERAWRQLVRWLITDVPLRVQATAEPLVADANGAVRLQVRVRDEKFQPVDDAVVTVSVEPVAIAGAVAVAPIRLEAEADPAEPGLYQLTYVPRQDGGFRAVAQVKNHAGAELGRAETGWSSDLAAEEFRSLAPNVAQLETIARKTGGEVVRAEDLDAFVRRLPDLRAPVMETWSHPAWHTPWVFALAVACLLAEWGLRRWRGMP
jgi:uncharacterized membrane protein